MTSQLPANTEDIPLERCWELLTQQRIARLAVVHQGEPDIFPVSYIVDHGGIAVSLCQAPQLDRRHALPPLYPPLAAAVI